jgi:hypothetical protein
VEDRNEPGEVSASISFCCDDAPLRCRGPFLPKKSLISVLLSEYSLLSTKGFAAFNTRPRCGDDASFFWNGSGPRLWLRGLRFRGTASALLPSQSWFWSWLLCCDRRNGLLLKFCCFRPPRCGADNLTENLSSGVSRPFMGLVAKWFDLLPAEGGLGA